MLKRLFLTLLTCFALIFPGKSVCATELQTDIEDSGDPANDVSKFYNNDIFYYKPESAALKEVLSSTSPYPHFMTYGLTDKDYQTVVSYDDLREAYSMLLDDTLAMQRRLNYFGRALVCLMLMLFCIIVYNVVTWFKHRREIAEYEEIILYIMLSRGSSIGARLRNMKR